MQICTKCKNRSFIKLDRNAVRSHLEGKDPLGQDVIGVYPLLPDNTTHFVVIDFDKEDWQKDCPIQVMPEGGFENIIALPLQGLARKNHNSEFIDEDFVSYPDQWSFLTSVEKVSESSISDFLHQFCTNDGLGELADFGDNENSKL